MESTNVQVAFFQHVKSRLAPHLSLVDEVAELLNISIDSAYRRIRAEKAISFEELQKLSSHYKISLDHFLHLESNSFIFSGNLANASDFTFADYLSDMLQQFKFMASFASKHFFFLTKDIPPWAHFQIPELMAFRAYFWTKSILHYDDMRIKKFSVDSIPDEFRLLGQKIVEWNNRLPSTEIWNIEMVNSFIRQIQFYRDSGSFSSPRESEILIEKAIILMDHFEKQAELGVKFSLGEKPLPNAGSYSLFINELSLGDNTAFCTLDDQHITYINHSVINFMYTRDARYNDYMHKALQNLVSKSTQISEVGERERIRFFNRIRDRIRQASR